MTNSELRVITSENAQDILARHKAGTLFNLDGIGVSLAHTVATEPDRTRAAVVRALRLITAQARQSDLNTTAACGPNSDWSEGLLTLAETIDAWAEMIENGADY